MRQGASGRISCCGFGAGTVWGAHQGSRGAFDAPPHDACGASGALAGKLHWLHVMATTTLIWLGSHASRGKKAFDAFSLWHSKAHRPSPALLERVGC